MKRLVKKAFWPEQTYSFEEVKGLIRQEVPVLFGLDTEKQAKLKKILETIEASVENAARITKLGKMKLEVGIINEKNVIAQCKHESETLTLNSNDDQLQKTMNASPEYIKFIGAHEYGHYVDEKLGWVSQTEEWNNVVSKTNIDYLEGYDVNDATDKSAEKFANAFVSWLWKTQDNSVTKFIDGLIKRGI